MLAYRFMDKTGENQYLLDGIHPVRRNGKEVKDKVGIVLGEYSVDYMCWFIEKESSLALFSTYGRYLGVFEIGDGTREGDSHPDVVWSSKFKLLKIVPADDYDDLISGVFHSITSKTNLQSKSYGPMVMKGVGQVDDVLEASGVGKLLADVGDDLDAVANVKLNIMQFLKHKDKVAAEATYLFEYAKRNSAYSEISLNLVELVSKDTERNQIYDGLNGLGRNILDGAIASMSSFILWNWAMYKAGAKASESAAKLFELKILPMGFVGGTTTGLFCAGGDPNTGEWLSDNEAETIKLLTQKTMCFIYSAGLDLDSRIYGAMLSGNYLKTLPMITQQIERMNEVKLFVGDIVERLNKLEEEE